MQPGMMGFGRMGANTVRRLQRTGHRCVAFDRNAESAKQVATDGLTPSASLDDLVRKLQRPRAVWLMVPAAVVAAGSWRLKKADTLLARDGRAWRAIEEERLSSETGKVPATGKATAHVL
jgi:6-phosphogluconate dehydrogenase (decarboxylating)